MLCKKELIPKQHHAFFNSHTVTTSGGKKDETDSNSDSSDTRLNRSKSTLVILRKYFKY